MNELKIDNPAKRLLDILNAGKKIPLQHNCRVAWRQLLETQDGNEILLITRLGKVMGLPARIIQILKDHFPDQQLLSNHWKEQIENAFYKQEISGNWSTFINHINNQTISELNLLSIVFETRGAHSSIDAAEIERLLDKVTELRNEIRTSELSNNIKTLLLRQLAQLQEALETYGILGIEPIMDAVQSTVGLAVINDEYREEITSGSQSKFGDRVSSILNEVANVITVAGALPALPAVIQSALTYLTK